ncbi:MAG: TonB-dependent receptor, partial [Cyclobacteriaceae bacterium]|nr:TonB-dependent receptor [Cyclobacteriaceae bacterium]
LEYLENNGVVKNTQNKKINLGLRLDQKLLNDKLNIGINNRTSIINDEFGPNVVGAAIAFDPTKNILDENNQLRGGYFQWPAALATPNPVATQRFTNNQGATIRNLTALSLRYELPFLDGFTLNSKISYDYAKGNFDGYTYQEAKESQNNGGSSVIQEQVKKINLYDYFVNYKKTINRHDLDVTLGYSWQNFKTSFNEVRGDSLKQVDGTLKATYNIRPLDLPVENRLIGFFGRLKYEFAGKYIFTTSLRRDGSSRFGLSNRWGMFPAVSFGWRVLEENFASSLTSIFNDLKLRVSYGVTGNEQIGDYRYATYYRYSIAGASYQFGDQYVPTLRPTGVDPNIKWEETVSTNIGLDFGFLKGKLTASIDYYNKDVNDLLYEIAVPAGSNLSDRILTNIGRVNNKGIELVLDAQVMDRKDFTWRLNFNISYNKNEIKKLDNLVGEGYSRRS